MSFPKQHLESLWAPWRVEYFERPPAPGSNFLLEAAQASEDAAYLVVTRRRAAFLLMNGYPYATGHLMAAPYREVASMEDLSEQEVLDLWGLCIHAQRLLKRAVGAENFNIGLNLGSAAGAGFPQHMHLHIVPRWSGDTNFMAVVAQTRILPEGLQKTYAKLLAVQEALDACPEGVESNR